MPLTIQKLLRAKWLYYLSFKFRFGKQHMLVYCEQKYTINFVSAMHCII